MNKIKPDEVYYINSDGSSEVSLESRVYPGKVVLSVRRDIDGLDDKAQVLGSIPIPAYGSTKRNRLRELREERKLTQSDVAHIFGVNIRVISGHETGDRGVSLESIKRYAGLYKVYTCELFVDPQAPGRQPWNGEDPVSEEEHLD